jgi:hypothetical protein
MSAGVEGLLETETLPELGPGPRAGVQTVEELRSRFKKLGDADSELAFAVVFLWHDHLDEAHTIAQGVEDANGSYVHAIMHRREPDYSNAKYWFRRVGRHECYDALAKEARGLLEKKGPQLLKRLVPSGAWDAFAFVDACETAKDADEPLLREVQALEIRILLKHLIGG